MSFATVIPSQLRTPRPEAHEIPQIATPSDSGVSHLRVIDLECPGLAFAVQTAQHLASCLRDVERHVQSANDTRVPVR